MKQISVFVGLFSAVDEYRLVLSSMYSSRTCVCDQIKINYRVDVNRNIQTCHPETWRLIFEGLVDDKRNISDVTRGAASSAGARFESIVHIDLVG